MNSSLQLHLLSAQSPRPKQALPLQKSQACRLQRSAATGLVPGQSALSTASPAELRHCTALLRSPPAQQRPRVRNHLRHAPMCPYKKQTLCLEALQLPLPDPFNESEQACPMQAMSKQAPPTSAVCRAVAPGPRAPGEDLAGLGVAAHGGGVRLAAARAASLADAGGTAEGVAAAAGGIARAPCTVLPIRGGAIWHPARGMQEKQRLLGRRGACGPPHAHGIGQCGLPRKLCGPRGPPATAQRQQTHSQGREVLVSLAPAHCASGSTAPSALMQVAGRSCQPLPHAALHSPHSP